MWAYNIYDIEYSNVMVHILQIDLLANNNVCQVSVTLWNSSLF